MTICEFCEQNNREFQPNICHHNLRLDGIEDIDDQYDSDFDVENFDSEVIGPEVCEIGSQSSPLNDNHEYEIHPNDCTQESENKYETIDGIKTPDETYSLDNSDSNDDKSEGEDQNEEQNQTKETTLPPETDETYDSPKTCEISKECLTDV